MPCRIFISYRRGVEAVDGVYGSNKEEWAARNMDEWAARSIYEHLVRKLLRFTPTIYTDEFVFMDIDGIAGGANFHDVLEEKLNQAEMLLAVIGPSWLGAKDKSGNLRLRKPDDYVKREIETAIFRKNDGMALIPVLVNKAVMPKKSELSAIGLEALSDCNAVHVRHLTLEADLNAVMRRIK